ncbi:MAG: hypothetical protein HRU19_08405 [Pseudobacteriovorax sp.]|nr:hypothetical protein [Pseudobacteriovorax sp.]
MKPSGRRRGFSSWFVEPHRQVKLGLMFLCLNLVFSFVILLVFGFYFYDVYSTVSEYFQLSASQSNQVLNKFLPPIFIAAALTVLFIVTSILLSVKYTHKIYGPLVSIHRHLDGLLSGEKLPQLNLRESDQLKELADKINELQATFSVDRRKSGIRPMMTHIEQLISGQVGEQLVLREDDPLKPLAEKLNELSQKISASK